jgi:hypothetical protein
VQSDLSSRIVQHSDLSSLQDLAAAGAVVVASSATAVIERTRVAQRERIMACYLKGGADGDKDDTADYRRATPIGTGREKGREKGHEKGRKKGHKKVRSRGTPWASRNSSTMNGQPQQFVSVAPTALRPHCRPPREPVHPRADPAPILT